jgi:hypothetical protein
VSAGDRDGFQQTACETIDCDIHVRQPDVPAAVVAKLCKLIAS